MFSYFLFHCLDTIRTLMTQRWTVITFRCLCAIVAWFCCCAVSLAMAISRVSALPNSVGNFLRYNQMTTTVVIIRNSISSKVQSILQLTFEWRHTFSIFPGMRRAMAPLCRFHGIPWSSAVRWRPCSVRHQKQSRNYWRLAAAQQPRSQHYSDRWCLLAR